MMVMGQGIALSLANGQPIAFRNAADSFAYLGTGRIAGIPVPVYVLAVAMAVAVGVLRFTRFGRNVYAVGDSREAARLSGINVAIIEFSVYVISGLLASLTALILVSRLTVGQPTAGTGLELEAIAIVVIGGTSLFGGVGGVSGTIAGAAIVSVLANLLNLIGVSPFNQQIVKGVILVVAVLIAVQQLRRRE
jgi:ribose/xylose/arabinose/galactoside ABC-type transport system permease subunit